MKICLVGLPNSGKTTLFNALTKSEIEVTDYATKAEPNLAIVDVMDTRVTTLSDMYKPKKTVFATIEIIDLAGEYNLPILSDEIYDQITYDKPYTCPATLSKDVPVIGLNGFSKTHLVTGWRLGYLYYYDPENKLEELKSGIAKMARARLSASSVAQFAAVEILKTPSNHTVDMVRKLKERRLIASDTSGGYHHRPLVVTVFEPRNNERVKPSKGNVARMAASKAERCRVDVIVHLRKKGL